MDVFLESVKTDFQGYVQSREDVAERQKQLDKRYNELRLQTRFNISRKPQSVLVSSPPIPKEARRHTRTASQKPEQKTQNPVVIRSWLASPRLRRRRFFETPVLVRKSYHVPGKIKIDEDANVDVQY